MSLRVIPRFALPYGIGDFAAAAGALLTRRIPSPEPFRAVVGDAHMFWTSSGRQALWLALAGLDLPPGSGVAVPLFNDLSVTRAVVEAGYKPVYIDVDEATLTMSPAKLHAARGRFSAVAMVHLFGQVADVDGILAAAGGVPVVEDTAHAPLSLYRGRQVGSFGSACFYSFASTKYWPAGGGGLLAVRDSALASRVERNVATLRRQPLGAEIRNLGLQLGKSILFHRLLYGVAGVPLRRRVEKQGILEPVLSRDSIQTQQAAVALRQAKRFSERVRRQRANSQRLLSRLGHPDGVVLPYEPRAATYNYHIFPVLMADRRERDSTMSAMLAQGVDTSKIYFNVIGYSRQYGYDGGCPVSESIADRLLTLPNYASLSNSDIDFIASVFLRTLQWKRRAAGGPILDEVSESRRRAAGVQHTVHELTGEHGHSPM